MNESSFKNKLDKLTEEIHTLPADQRKKMEGLVEETKIRHTQIKKNIGALQDSLDRLRLSTKYLLFDLEATRRENAYLRKMLDQGDK